jgi:hypothetical protein
MRRTIIIALVATMTAVVAVPAAAYYLSSGDEDPLSNTLRGYGFVPIKPPSNLMKVGSLYYVDAAVRDFKAICHPARSDLTVANADAFAERLRPILAELAGLSANAAAQELDCRGYATARGGKWTAGGVINLRARLGQ